MLEQLSKNHSQSELASNCWQQHTPWLISCHSILLQTLKLCLSYSQSRPKSASVVPENSSISSMAPSTDPSVFTLINGGVGGFRKTGIISLKRRKEGAIIKFSINQLPEVVTLPLEMLLPKATDDAILDFAAYN